MKNKFSTNRANFFDLKILIPVIHKDTDISTEIKPKDWKNKSDTIIKQAIKRMMPKGPLGSTQLSNCKIYLSNDHPHQAQNPKILDIKKINIKNQR